MPKEKKEPSQEKLEGEEEYYDESEGLMLDDAIRSVRTMVRNVIKEVNMVKENTISDIAQIRPIRNFLRKRIVRQNIIRRRDYEED